MLRRKRWWFSVCKTRICISELDWKKMIFFTSMDPSELERHDVKHGAIAMGPWNEALKPIHVSVTYNFPCDVWRRFPWTVAEMRRIGHRLDNTQPRVFRPRVEAVKRPIEEVVRAANSFDEVIRTKLRTCNTVTRPWWSGIRAMALSAAAPRRPEPALEGRLECF